VIAPGQPKQTSGFLTPAQRVALLLDLRSNPVYHSLFCIAFFLLTGLRAREKQIASDDEGLRCEQHEFEVDQQRFVRDQRQSLEDTEIRR
jgi:hypothetical protein